MLGLSGTRKGFIKSGINVLFYSGACYESTITMWERHKGNNIHKSLDWSYSKLFKNNYSCPTAGFAFLSLAIGQTLRETGCFTIMM
jgi:hypothetical protein